MSYYLRYLSADPRPVTLDDLGAALAAADRSYLVEEDAAGALVHFGDRLIAQLEINVPGDGLFEEELAELHELAEEGSGAGRERVAEVVAGAKALVAVQVLWDGEEADAALGRLDPLWEWLFRERPGLLQADGEVLGTAPAVFTIVPSAISLIV